jgi:tetratricopeptide (TPR) repeat protein
MKGDYDRAIADCTEAIRLDPDFDFAYAIRGASYGVKDDYDRAIADLETVLRIDPDYDWAKRQLEIIRKRGR